MRIAALIAALLFSTAAAAQDKTIKFLVGFPAGAGLDTMTRLVADKMRVSLGQPVVVENRPGAAGQIAMSALKAAAPDGLTLVMTPLVTVVTAPHVYAKLPYDAFADFAPVAHTANFLFAFTVGPAVPLAGSVAGPAVARTCRALIASRLPGRSRCPPRTSARWSSRHRG